MNGNGRDRARAAVWASAATLLREGREVHGWEQGELARRAGVSLGVVAQFELGQSRHPALEPWWRLCAALGFDLLAFLECAEERSGATLLEDVISSPRDLLARPAGTAGRPRDAIGGSPGRAAHQIGEVTGQPEGPAAPAVHLPFADRVEPARGP
jgi:transcriptional regulator with XRE-family HTH domain